MLIGIAVLVVLIAAVAFFFFAGKGQSFKVGDQVYAEWTPTVWYPGKIDKTCEKGFHVAFNDGDEKCASAQELIADVTPKASDVKVGTRVIAQWANGPFYTASVTAISGDQYSIVYSDKTPGVKTLNELRLDPRKITETPAPAATTPVTTPPATTPDVTATTTPSTSKFKTGDTVVAVWSGSSWYKGKIEGTCANGLTVKWDDGSTPSCVPEAKINALKSITKADAKVDTAVFAKWSGSAYCDAKITKVSGDKYDATCTDGYKVNGVSLDSLLLK